MIVVTFYIWNIIVVSVTAFQNVPARGFTVDDISSMGCPLRFE